ncbi:sugar ABC transporter ATP-binding protein [Labrys monachus]|uniref:Ribose transport system ATP-binding protein n=1 Tax=Labrys monachus TaxID=217067 RepID=A0ABU0FG65_9HYPH|nr:sugar ABC transporter ATP-binding protein [Labrys monachus]MDQ0393332.1 ribose transport system ATP-binding protein [Labrys monachus]
MPQDSLLSIRSLSKAYGPVRALSDVQFDLRAGEIHALAGENGAGKSTLMKIISGIVTPDEGEIRIDGELVVLDSAAKALSLGIGLVHQEIVLCPDVTVAENILMAATARRRTLFMNYRALEARARQAMNRLAPIPVDTLVGSLPISHQQLVEIAKALTLDCRILILDEPTAALTERETDSLFAILRELRAEGVAIIYISHRMAEIFALCDRITVFRDGRYIGTEDIASTTPEQVVTRMVGRQIENLYPPKSAAPPGAPLLEVRGLAGDRFRSVDFDVGIGEIVGFAGLIGAGRSEIVKAVCGLYPRSAGTLTLRGKPVAFHGYADAVAEGVVYLSENRKTEGVFLDLSIAANISALDLGRVSSRLGALDFRKETNQARLLGRRVNLKAGSLSDPVSTLSGGNQQKVAIAKMLSVDPALVFLDEPTRGVDVGAKSEIHRILRDLCNAGVGVVVISSELPELIGLCDRILVVHEGGIAGTVEGEDMTEETIIRLASGLSPNARAA